MKPREGAKRNFSPLFVARKALAPGVYWDTKQKGLALRVAATDYRSYACIYSFHSRPRWYTVGDAKAIDLSTARKVARSIMNAVAEGRDPQAEKKAERMAGTFAELAERYLNEWASKRNKSWKQGRTLVTRYCLPRWAKLKPAQITRADVRALLATVEAPVLQNQILASASAVFSWAVKQEIMPANPCAKVDRNATRSRERVLSDSEMPLFWSAFSKAGVAGMALKLILLTGQRPGEVAHLHRAHLVDGWWEQPGAPDAKLPWPGTKNAASHRIWLPTPAQELIADGGTGFVFATSRGKPSRSLNKVMREICATLKVERATPHDLRRTHGSTITGLGFGRDAMNRIQNHREGGIASVYDRHAYAEENKRIMETVAAHIMALAEGKPESSNVADLAAHRAVAAR
jgi:integrase